MDTIYFTVTGTCFRYGTEPFEAGTQLRLVKEPDNEHDREAIKVEFPGLGTIGYVANSVKTVLGESYSAGRLYDNIGDTAAGTVMLKLPNALLCTVSL